MRHEPNVLGLSSEMDVECAQKDGSVTKTETFGKAEGSGCSRSPDKEDIPIPTMHIRGLMIARAVARPKNDFFGLRVIMISDNRADAEE